MNGLTICGTTNKAAVATGKRKVLVVSERYDFWSSYYSPFRRLGEQTTNERIIDCAPELLVCAVFTGGADVSPELYGQVTSRQTSSTPYRDKFEVEVFNACVKAGIPIFGICRGAQLSCVMAGGTLCQHLTHHGYSDHTCKTHDGETVVMNSYHHQMQLPPDDAEVLVWADPKLSSYYIGSGDVDIDVDREIEVVHYPNVNALGVQYHPELHQEWEQGWTYYQKLITDFLSMQRSLDRDEPRTMLKKSA